MTTDTTAYLIFLAVSLAGCFLLYALLLRPLTGDGRRAAALGGLSLALSVPLGLAGAKLLYLLFRFSYLLKTGLGDYLLSLRAEELSYYGAVAGVCLGVFLAARLLGEKPGKALNAFAFPGALLAALARFAEYWLGALGTGDFLEEGLPFPFAVSEIWNPDFPEYYLAIFMLEGVLYLRVAVFALGRRRDPLCFLRTVFYLCLGQIICESMRAQSIRWLFVRYEQLLCYLVAEGILVWYAVRSKKRGVSNPGAAIFGLGVCALVILGEFMLDGKITLGEYGLPPVAIYGIMAWALLEMTVMEHRARRRMTEAGYPAEEPLPGNG